MKTTQHGDRATAGFTLIEVLIAMLLMVIILTALADVTAQWLPNWKRGYDRVQRMETVALGLDRLVADLSAAQFVYAGRKAVMPMFDGRELSVTFVRSAIGPNTPPGLEVVRIEQTVDQGENVLVRTRMPFAPLPPDGTINQLAGFSDPVVLLRAPYKITFSYAGEDRVWRSTWQNADLLPSAIRISVHDEASDLVLPISTVATVHVQLPAECAKPRPPKICTPPKPNGGGQKVMSPP
jgi:general secretion pathway protein J